MKKTGSFIYSIKRGEYTLEIAMYIVISAAIIFYIDSVTALGLAVWILYFIPLLLTMYLSWKYAPFLAAGAFILLTFISYFLAPEDVPMEIELLNRGFFSVVMVVAAFFIYWMVNFTTRELLG